MKQTDKAALRAKLDRLGEDWVARRTEDEAVKRRLCNDIFILVYELFPGSENEINTIFMYDWNRFDPAKGSASSFFASRIRFRKKDEYRRQRKQMDFTVEDTSLEGDDGPYASLLDSLPAGPDADPEKTLRMEAALYELMVAILELPNRLRGQANNPRRHSYYRMFFTDSIVTYLHAVPPPEELFLRERELFAAMKQEFLDYFMEKHCRTVAEICNSPLKPYGELVEGQDMAETELPLPAKVYISYLARVENTNVSPSAVSQQKENYQKFIHQFRP